MSKTIHKFKIPKVHRNILAVAARGRRAETFHDRRAPRGGARNEMADLLEEIDDYDLDDVG